MYLMKIFRHYALLHCFIFALVSFFCAGPILSAPSQSLVSPLLKYGDLYLVKVANTTRPLIVSGEAPYAIPVFITDVSDGTKYTIVIGAGLPVSVSETDAGNALNSTIIPSTVFDLSSNPPELPAPLDTVQVPDIKKIVSSSIAPQLSRVYILNCSGDARTGGAALGRGDADFMDYAADGTGATDIGDGNTDYGVGIDETDVTVSPRKYKWGGYRADHDYFLIYIGTGNPIQFLYFDSNYGDNSPSDTLPVKIYPSP